MIATTVLSTKAKMIQRRYELYSIALQSKCVFSENKSSKKIRKVFSLGIFEGLAFVFLSN